MSSNTSQVLHFFHTVQWILFSSSSENEDDMLDKAWGLEPDSRLSCQAKIGEDDLVIEIPKYTINMVSENH